MIAVPDIFHFKLIDNIHDFIMIGCDGIYDKMTTEDVIYESWHYIKNVDSSKNSVPDINKVCG